MVIQTDHDKLVDKFAYKEERQDAIIALVGAINARDLALVKLTAEAKAALLNGLKHDNAKVRWWCLQLIDHVADESFVPYVLAMLDDPVGKVRRHAVHALTCEICKPEKCGLALSKDVYERLQIVAVNDSDVRVRNEAQDALDNW